MPEEGLKVHRFAAVLPEQLLTQAGRHRDAVLPADQRALMRCLGDDLAGLVHDVSHSRIALSGSTSAVQRTTRGLHVCSRTHNAAQPVKPCATALMRGLIGASDFPVLGSHLERPLRMPLNGDRLKRGMLRTNLEGVLSIMKSWNEMPKEAPMRVLALAILAIMMVSTGPAGAQTQGPDFRFLFRGGAK